MSPQRLPLFSVLLFFSVLLLFFSTSISFSFFPFFLLSLSFLLFFSSLTSLFPFFFSFLAHSHFVSLGKKDDSICFFRLRPPPHFRRQTLQVDKLKMVRSQAQKDRAKEIRKPVKPKSQQQKERAKEIRKTHTPRSETQKDRQKEIRQPGLKKGQKDGEGAHGGL